MGPFPNGTKAPAPLPFSAELGRSGELSRSGELGRSGELDTEAVCWILLSPGRDVVVGRGLVSYRRMRMRTR